MTSNGIDTATIGPNGKEHSWMPVSFGLLGGLAGAAAAFPLTMALVAGDSSSTAALLLIMTVPLGFAAGALVGAVAGSRLK